MAACPTLPDAVRQKEPLIHAEFVKLSRQRGD
jgi:hypothetical protein